MKVFEAPIRVGEPLRHRSLSVFPPFTERQASVEYQLSTDGLQAGSVLIEEVSDRGSVPELLVKNTGDMRVLFLEGEELVGAKQNRVLNTSVLVAANSETKIPVSCVEQGRWNYATRSFRSSGSHLPSKLRKSLKESVSRSLKAGRSYQSDQGKVWQDVAALHCEHKVKSGTGALSDAFESYQDRIDEFRSAITYPAGACGVAIAVGDRVLSVDLFDKPSTCEKVWERLISGVVFDALSEDEAQAKEKTEPAPADVSAMISQVADFSWEPAEAVGEGEEHRAESEQGDHASALTLHVIADAKPATDQRVKIGH